MDAARAQKAMGFGVAAVLSHPMARVEVIKTQVCLFLKITESFYYIAMRAAGLKISLML